MLKEPLLFCAIGGCRVRSAVCVFFGLSRRTEHVFDPDKVFDCVSLCGRKLFRAARIVFFGRMCYTNDVRKTVCRKAALHQEKER